MASLTLIFKLAIKIKKSCKTIDSVFNKIYNLVKFEEAQLTKVAIRSLGKTMMNCERGSCRSDNMRPSIICWDAI